MRETPILDALWCASHPFKCIGDALGPFWWVIGIFVGLILIGIAYRLARAAYTLGGWPAVVGALGVIGTILVVVAGAISRVRGKDTPDTDIDGPDAAPSVSRRAPRERKPLFPRLRKRLKGD
jgi:hypothetical protein